MSIIIWVASLGVVSFVFALRSMRSYSPLGNPVEKQKLSPIGEHHSKTYFTNPHHGRSEPPKGGKGTAIRGTIVKL